LIGGKGTKIEKICILYTVMLAGKGQEFLRECNVEVRYSGENT
jgi:FKBP-type peptidyl-prolyl cis-trans isomerase